MSKITGKSLVLFADNKHQETHTGILLSNGDIMSLCCGGIVPPDEYKILWNNNGFAYLDEIVREGFN